MAQTARQATARAESTRAAILVAAERLFAERGFDKARLEDVAEAVGIRRASIVYYFKDKREVYDAVLEGVFGDFRDVLEAELTADGRLRDRIEGAVGAWVDYVGSRPTFARILLREVAGGAADAPGATLVQIAPFVDLVKGFLAKHAGDELLRSMPIDPAHVAATVAGATVFFVAAIPMLVPDIRFDPVSPEHLRAHRNEVLRITRRLIGMREDDAS